MAHIAITNPSKKKKKGGKKKKKKTAKRNPSKKRKKSKSRRRRSNPSFLGGAFKRLTNDAKLAIPNLGGRYVAEIAGGLGNNYLGERLGNAASSAGIILGHFALSKFGKNTEGWKLARIGLLAEGIHQAAVAQAGIDVPAMAMDAFSGAPATTEETATEGVGAISDDALQTRLAGTGVNPYMEAYAPY